MADKMNNTGQENTGKNNSGYINFGSYNSGGYNSGGYNSGYINFGDYNSGDRNFGDYNSGDVNLGSYNSGSCNFGSYNSGSCNFGSYNSGLFNSTEGTVRLFNKQTDLTWDQIDHPHATEFHVTKWISEDDMTDEEKKADPKYNVRGGYLRQYTYKEAWANFWKDTDETNRQKFLNLPNFDADVFLEITGIDVRKKKK